MDHDAEKVASLFDIADSGVDLGQVAMAAALEKLVGFLTPERMMLLVIFGAVEIDDYARAFGKKPQTIRNLMARRELPFVPFGNKNLILVESVRELLRKKEIKPRGSH